MVTALGLVLLPLGRREPDPVIGLKLGEASTLRSLLGTVDGGRGDAAERLHTHTSISIMESSLKNDIFFKDELTS